MKFPRLLILAIFAFAGPAFAQGDLNSDASLEAARNEFRLGMTAGVILLSEFAKEGAFDLDAGRRLGAEPSAIWAQASMHIQFLRDLILHLSPVAQELDHVDMSNGLAAIVEYIDGLSLREPHQLRILATRLATLASQFPQPRGDSKRAPYMGRSED